MGNEFGSTDLDAEGNWYIDVDRDDAEDVSFTLDGKSAGAEVTPKGDGQSEVAVTAMDDGTTAFPDTGSVGLADSGVSTGLIGLLIALGVASIAGLGLRRARNRA